MKDRLASLRRDLALRAGPALRSLAAHRFWLECGAVTFFALVAAFAVGTTALRRAETLRGERARLEETRSGVDRWMAEARPAVAAESLLWRESEQAIQRATGGSAGGLAAAHLVATRAEEVGIPDVRVRLLPPDSLPPAAAATPGASAVAVEFEGDWSTVLNFLGVLPPPMNVVEIGVTRSGGLLTARALVLSPGAAQ